MGGRLLPIGVGFDDYVRTLIERLLKKLDGKIVHFFWEKSRVFWVRFYHYAPLSAKAERGGLSAFFICFCIS